MTKRKAVAKRESVAKRKTVAKRKADIDREKNIERLKGRAQELSGGEMKVARLNDMRLYLKYYADDDFRRQWQKDWPRDPIPKHEDPPYDRDRLLPKPDYGQPGGGEPN